MNPLETRSLPHGLWQFVPNVIVRSDESLRMWLANVPLDKSPWWQIRWLTEEPQGIASGLAILLLLAALWTCRQKTSWPRPTPPSLWWSALFAAWVGCSDLVATAIKYVIGRLKPHVTFYNPNFTPALSCPSSHAFNTAFALNLAWFALEHKTRQRYRVLFAVSAFITAVIGISRVILGQHYPIDVLVGWLTGGALGRAMAPTYRWVASLRTKRS